MEKPVMPRQVNVREEDTSLVLCQKCQGPYFMQATTIRKLSAILSPSGREEIFPVPVLVCMGCGEVLDQGGA